MSTNLRSRGARHDRTVSSAALQGINHVDPTIHCSTNGLSPVPRSLAFGTTPTPSLGDQECRPLVSQKRARDEDDEGRSSKRQKSDASTNSRRRSTDSDPRLACPYSLREPTRYPQCFLARISDINSLCQHLKRYHMQPVHCARCGMIYKCKKARDALHQHLRTDCKVMQFQPPEGLSEDDLTEIRRACSVKKTSDNGQGWMKAYELLFNEPFQQESPADITPWMGPPQVELPKRFAREYRKIGNAHKDVEHLITDSDARSLKSSDLAARIVETVLEGFEIWVVEASIYDDPDEDFNQSYEATSARIDIGCYSNDVNSMKELSAAPFVHEGLGAGAYEALQDEATANPQIPLQFNHNPPSLDDFDQESGQWTVSGDVD